MAASVIEDLVGNRISVMRVRYQDRGFTAKGAIPTMPGRTEDYGMASDIEKVIWQRQSISNESRDGEAANSIGLPVAQQPGKRVPTVATRFAPVSEVCKDENTGRDR